MQPVLTIPTNAAHNLRRSVVLAGVLGGLSLLVAAFVGHVMTGLFGCVGLGLGALNSWLVQRSVLRFAASVARKRRQFTLSVLSRLALVTALALACALLARPDGLGVFAGLAAFQLLMLGGAALPLAKELRQS